MLNINWKPVRRMQPGDRHIHEETYPTLDAIRYARGHYVNRPYLQYASSKWEAAYIDLYDILMNPWKYRPDVSVLEFGVYTGESIRYLRDYFVHPDVKIVGFDNRPCEFYGYNWLAKIKGVPETPDAGEKYDGPAHNVTFFQGDQRSAEDVKGCCEKHGPFDVVIDDGSHDPQLTENVFRITWPYVKENGLYLIEDIAEEAIRHLMNEITVLRQGRGVILRPTGFGPGQGGGSCVCLALLKSKDRITGVQEDLVEE